MNTRLDLINAADEERRLVSQFLLPYGKNRAYIVANSEFSEPNSNATYQFAQPLLLKTRTPETQYPHYYVVGSTLGKGNYGAVATVGYKIKLTEAGYELKQYQSPYVIKIQCFKMSESSSKDEQAQIKAWKNRIEREFQLIEAQEALHGKNLAFNKKGKTAFFLMRQIPGVNLYQWMTLNPGMTPEQRYAITQALLDAYDAQLYQKNIVHADIKPHNIMLNVVDGAYHPTFVDYGYAVEVKDMTLGYQISGVWGTPYYIAPQLYRSSALPTRLTYNVDTDIWSLVVVLAEVWGLNLDKFNRLPQASLPFAIADAIIPCDTLPVALRQYVANAKLNNFKPPPSKESLFTALRAEVNLSTTASPEQAEAFKQAELPMSSFLFEGLMTGLVLTLALGLAATIILLTHGAAAIFLVAAYTALSVNLTLPGTVGLLIVAASVLPIIGGVIGKRLSHPPRPTLFSVSRSESQSGSFNRAAIPTPAFAI